MSEPVQGLRMQEAPPMLAEAQHEELAEAQHEDVSYVAISLMQLGCGDLGQRVERKPWAKR